MKALTISQPYASLIASGEKWIENRTWWTSYRGPLAIHAGRGKQYLSGAELTKFVTGAVVAIADLVAAISLAPLRVGRRSGVLDKLGISVESVLSNPHAEGPVLWILRDVRKLRVPMPCQGSQGLWDWDGAPACDLSKPDAELFA